MIRILRRLTATIGRLIEGAYKLRGILRKKGFIREFRGEIEGKATGAYLESLHGFQDRRPPCQAATLPPCWANGKDIESESCSGLPLADRDRCPHRKLRPRGAARTSAFLGGDMPLGQRGDRGGGKLPPPRETVASGIPRRPALQAGIHWSKVPRARSRVSPA